MKPEPVFILQPSSFIFEGGRDNAASPTFFKTNSVGRIVPPLRISTFFQSAYDARRLLNNGPQTFHKLTEDHRRRPPHLILAHHKEWHRHAQAA